MKQESVSYSVQPGAVCAPAGFSAAAAYAGVRRAQRDDLTLIVSEVPASVAGVFTTSQAKAWCVLNNIRRIRPGKAQAIICNAGNANACNGEEGCRRDEAMASSTAELLSSRGAFEGPVLTASTGVIGVPLPIDRIEQTLSKLVGSLERSAAAASNACRAIMTTDLAPKEAAFKFRLPCGFFSIGGIAKGSGMIAPNMATMLAFITTDAMVSPAALQAALAAVVKRSFNCVTVDGDTSTNDSVIALANGLSGVNLDSHPDVLEDALWQVCSTLAKKIAADGEGATKLVAVTVQGTRGSAERVARTIAESLLVKTALFGNDPNWGRILAAAGRSGVEFDPGKTEIRLAGHLVFSNGEPAAFSKDAVSSAMKAKEVEIVVDLGDPSGSAATVWTCDLSYDYVKINAEYTT